MLLNKIIDDSGVDNIFSQNNKSLPTKMKLDLLKTIPYFIAISVIIYIFFQMGQFKDSGESFTSGSIYAYDYSPEIGSFFDQDQIAHRNIQAEEIAKENHTQLVGSLFINQPYEVRQRMTAPTIEFEPRRQTIFDYSDIVL